MAPRLGPRDAGCASKVGSLVLRDNSVTNQRAGTSHAPARFVYL
jgi:hypothetical protein